MNRVQLTKIIKFNIKLYKLYINIHNLIHGQNKNTRFKKNNRTALFI